MVLILSVSLLFLWLSCCSIPARRFIIVTGSRAAETSAQSTNKKRNGLYRTVVTVRKKTTTTSTTTTEINVAFPSGQGGRHTVKASKGIKYRRSAESHFFRKRILTGGLSFFNNNFAIGAWRQYNRGTKYNQPPYSLNSRISVLWNFLIVGFFMLAKLLHAKCQLEV